MDKPIQRQISEASRSAILQLCYASAVKAATERGAYDVKQLTTFAETLAWRIEQWIVGGDHEEIIEINACDLDTFHYLNDILNHLQQTLPLIAHFDVVVTLRRLEGKLDDNTTATHGCEGGHA
jgi:hypothetical protein